MTQPHHDVFNRIHSLIEKDVKVADVAEHLVEKKIIKADDVSRYKSKPKNRGMVALVQLLRNRSFETFLDFVECIFLAQGAPPGKLKSIPVVESIIVAVQEFDKQHQSSHADRVIAVQEKYMQTEPHEDEVVLDSAQSLEGMRIESQAPIHLQGGSFRTPEQPPTELFAEDLTPPCSQTQKFEEKLLLSSYVLQMPDLDYVGEPKQVSFHSSGGEFLDFDQAYGFSLSVPSMAVPKGQEVNLKVGLCCYGPFSISEHYLLASDFAVVVADNKFVKPVTVTMDHCLLLPEYVRCSNVIVLKANHRNITEDGFYTFEELTYPDFVPDSVVPDSTKLTFEIEDFCILCATLRLSTSQGKMIPPSPIHLSSLEHIDDDNPSSSTSSFDEPTGVERSHSMESRSPPTVLRVSSTSSESGVDPSGSPQKPPYNLRKRKSDSLEKDSVQVPPQQDTTSAKSKRLARRKLRNLEQGEGGMGKRLCRVEYAAVLFQNEAKVIQSDEYQFVIFVTINCPGANKICKERAEKWLRSPVDLLLLPITFEKALTFVTDTKSSGWTTEADRTPTINFSDVQFHDMEPKERLARLEQKTCPPHLFFTAECNDGGSKKFSCKVTVKGAVTTETRDEVFFNIRATASALPRQNAMDPTAQNYPSTPGYHYQSPIYRHENFSPNPQSPPYHDHDIPANLSLSQSDLSQAQYSETGFTHDTQADFSRLQYGSQQWSSQDSPVLSHGQKARPYRLSQAGSQGSPSLPRGYVMTSKSGSLPRCLDGADSPNPEFLRSGSLSSHMGKLNVGSDMEADPGGPCSLPTYEQHPISHYDSQLTAEEKDRPITNTQYLKIIEHIRNWKFVARCGFGFSEAKVEQIESDYGKFQECAFQSFDKWRMKEGYTDSVSVWTILKILHRANEFEAIQCLIQDIVKSQ